MDPVERFGAVRAVEAEAKQRTWVRRRAFLRLPFVAALPVAATYAVLFLQQWLRARGWNIHGPGLVIAMALAGVPLLGSLAEIVSGLEVRELAKRWDGLAGWQRGVIGTGVVLVALALFLGIGFTVAVRVAGSPR